MRFPAEQSVCKLLRIAEHEAKGMSDLALQNSHEA